MEKILTTVAAFVLIFTLIGGGYYLGRQTPTLPSETTVPILTQIPTPYPTTIHSFPTQNLTPSKNISPSPTPIPKSVIITSDTELDGYRSSDGSGNHLQEIRVGRNVYLVSRGFVSFPLNEIPTGVNIIEARLKLYQAKIVGKPYSAGSVMIDHLNYGDSLDNSDYGIAALVSNFAVLSTSLAVDMKEKNVTLAIKEDIANARSLSQFRIHLSAESTGGTTVGDFIYFAAAENSLGSGNLPQLVVRYY